MPTPPSDATVRGPRRVAAALLSLALGAALLAGCSSEDVPLLGDEQPTSEPTQQAKPGAGVAPRLQRLLGDRARAIRGDRQRAFERTLAGGDQEALVTEERLFHNFSTLPLARFGYQLDPRSVRRRGKAVTAEVYRSVQLEGYDTVPVRTVDRMRFVRAPGSRRGWLVRSATDEEWRAEHDVPLQAWDLERIEVREGDRVLLVLDRASLGDSAELIGALERGIADVAPRVPYRWDERVVAYALRDEEFLRRLGDVPGGNPERLDAVTFPVRADGTSGRLAATRFVMAPRMLSRTPEVRDRLVRHELVHVALGVRDDPVPTWLSEGLAEWVSAADLPEEEQTIAADAVGAAADGVEMLPENDTFNGAEAGANYGIAWFAVGFVADTYGEQQPWALLDAMRAAGRGGAGSGADRAQIGPDEADAVLRDELGMGEAELAEAATRQILTTFG